MSNTPKGVISPAQFLSNPNRVRIVHMWPFLPTYMYINVSQQVLLPSISFLVAYTVAGFPVMATPCCVQASAVWPKFFTTAKMKLAGMFRKKRKRPAWLRAAIYWTLPEHQRADQKGDYCSKINSLEYDWNLQHPPCGQLKSLLEKEWAVWVQWEEILLRSLRCGFLNWMNPVSTLKLGSGRIILWVYFTANGTAVLRGWLGRWPLNPLLPLVWSRCQTQIHNHLCGSH